MQAQFEDARTPQARTELHRMQEDNARFAVHYSKYRHRREMDGDQSSPLFRWTVAAQSYHYDNIDIQIDPAVWRAFLADGPKDLPLYWWVRDNLAQQGADNGVIRGENKFGPPKPAQFFTSWGAYPLLTNRFPVKVCLYNKGKSAA